MVILLTGATGFLGRHVLKLLLSERHKVYALCREPTGRQVGNHVEIRCDLAAELPEDQIPWTEVDAVVHLAASGVKASSREWPDAVRVNIDGTLHLLTSLERHAAKKPRVIAVRTFYEHLIGDVPDLRNNPYIATKSIASGLVKLWSMHYEGSVALATIFQIFGPGDAPGSVLSYAARQLVQGKTAYFGSGSGSRDWLFVDDAADAIVSLLTLDDTGVNDWDIGSGRLTAIREMVEMLAGLAHAGASQLDFDSARDRPDAGLTLAATRFPSGWQPRTMPMEGLQRLLEAARMEVST